MRLRRAFAAALAVLFAAAPAAAQALIDAGPRFRADGPNADLYGRAEGYPACTEHMREFRCRVGAFSNFDSLFPSRVVAAGDAPAPLRRAPREPHIAFTHRERQLTLDDYLDRRPVTGLLIARDDTILVERYQYGRTDKQRLLSFSMSKTIIALLIGIAVEEGGIRSIDDFAETYAHGLRGTEYGRTPVRALLQMTSGVAFNEDPGNYEGDIFKLVRTARQDPDGSLAAVRLFNNRLAPPGQVFSYASAETVVLGLVLAGATGRRIADYTSEKLWQPLGAESNASWLVDAAGHELTFAWFNAVLRDWARLGLMLAHDGAWQGRQIVPSGWLREATTMPGPSSPPGTPQTSYPDGYGYQIWLMAADRRILALRGLRGQFVLVDPANRLVLVQTALSDGIAPELSALFLSLPAQLP